MHGYLISNIDVYAKLRPCFEHRLGLLLLSFFQSIVCKDSFIFQIGEKSDQLIPNETTVSVTCHCISSEKTVQVCS